MADAEYKTSRCAIFTCPSHLLVSFRILDGGYERSCFLACVRIVYYWIPQLGCSKGYVLVFLLLLLSIIIVLKKKKPLMKD
jgi:hypothetical protein